MPGDRCDLHCVASQPVWPSEIGPLILSERPANGGLSRIGVQSPGSNSVQSLSEIADSLWRTFEKLPFSRDCGRRPGSICTAWPLWHGIVRFADAPKRGRASKLVDQRHEPELAAVMGLRLDKVVAPDTHFSGSSDEPSPFVNIEFHQTFVSHFQ